MSDTTEVKRPRGRPRKNPVEREEKREPVKTTKHKMRAAPNWETVDPLSPDTPDRLFISKELIPDGMSLLWVTSTCRGQDMPQHRAEFEKKGWTPVHQDDFDGQFNGVFMPKNQEGEVNVEGLVLMARPEKMTEKAERINKQRAYEQVAIKEQALTGGDLPVTLDARHPSATNSNRISKSIERIEVPND